MEKKPSDIEEPTPIEINIDSQNEAKQDLNPTKGTTENSNKSKNNSITNIKQKHQNKSNQDLTSNNKSDKKKDNTNGNFRIESEDGNQNENSYNTNSTGSEVEADFSLSDKKQEFELKIQSESSEFARIKKVKNEANEIRKFISQEIKRLEDEENELSLNPRLQSEINFIAKAPKCYVRKKLFRMGLL